MGSRTRKLQQLFLPGSRAQLYSCGTWAFWALLLDGMWDLPGSRIKPVSPVLADFTTEPPGEPLAESSREELSANAWTEVRRLKNLDHPL